VALALFAAIAVLPAGHNFYYGHRLVRLTTSDDYNLELPPRRLVLAWQQDGADRRRVVEKARLLAHVREHSDTLGELAFHGLQAVWFVSLVGILIWPRSLTSVILLAPLLYLSPHLFYLLNIYCPRHIVIGYLAMGVAAMACRGEWHRRRVVAVETTHSIVSSRTLEIP
jgi:hypothetical protein